MKPCKSGGSLSELMASRQSSRNSQRAISTPRRKTVYSRGPQLEVVGDMHGWHDEAELHRQMPPQRLDPLQQLPALFGVDQRHQGVTDFQANVVQLQQAFQSLLLRRARRCSICGSVARRNGRGFLELTLGAVCQPRRSGGNRQEGSFRQSGNQRQRHHHPGCDPQRTAAGKQLLSDIGSPALLSEDDRVTTMPPATDTSSEGISVTSPSPTVRIV